MNLENIIEDRFKKWMFFGGNKSKPDIAECNGSDIAYSIDIDDATKLIESHNKVVDVLSTVMIELNKHNPEFIDSILFYRKINIYAVENLRSEVDIYLSELFKDSLWCCKDISLNKLEICTHSKDGDIIILLSINTKNDVDFEYNETLFKGNIIKQFAIDCNKLFENNNERLNIIFEKFMEYVNQNK